MWKESVSENECSEEKMADLPVDLIIFSDYV